MTSITTIIQSRPTVDDNARSTLQDVLRANDEEHLYAHIKELVMYADENPPMLFQWKNVEAFVQAIELAREQANAPSGVPLPADPLNLPPQVTVNDFKIAIMERLRSSEGSPRLGTTCLPCTWAECMKVGMRMANLDLNPWTHRIIAVAKASRLRIFPVADCFMPLDESEKLELVKGEHRNSVWGK